MSVADATRKLGQSLMEHTSSKVNGPSSSVGLRDSVELDMDDLFHDQLSRRNSLDSQCSDSGASERLVTPGIISRNGSVHVNSPLDDDDEEEEGASDDDDKLGVGEERERNGNTAKGLESSGSGRTTPAKLGVKDFELLKVVGQGAFGKVFQVKLKHTNEIYAMKVLKKSHILEKDHIDYMRVERQILTSVSHPFIVTLYNTFQTSSKLYMVMEFINGGHLFFQLYDQGLFTEDIARFFCAEMVLAVGHLHSLGFVHRDMKPENVLLGADGHVKVTDFGLAKCNMTDEPRTNSMCGTIEYMAPEVIIGKGHGKTVDWWSCGILLYEMLVGLPPWRSQNKNTLKKKITVAKLKLPAYLTSEAHSLIKSLLQRDPTKRLGYGPSGFDQVKKHPFFRTINWKKLENLEIPSPFKPIVTGADCVNNFDKEYTDQPALDTPCGTPDIMDSPLGKKLAAANAAAAAAGGGDGNGGVSAMSADGPGLDPFQGFSYCEPSLLETMGELSFTGLVKPNPNSAENNADHP